MFVIQAPTAFGKSALARTIMQTFGSVSYITPTNLLVDQYLQEFPDTNSLHRLDSYYCEEWMRPCPATRGRRGRFCSTKKGDKVSCQAACDLMNAKHRKSKPGVYNYHTYVAHKLHRDVLIVDEAHNLIPFIRDRMALRLWQHDYRYPLQAHSNDRLREWMQGLPAATRKHKKMQALGDALTMAEPYHIVTRATEEFNGRGTIRGEPEERDCIKLLPVDISNAPRLFWPSSVQKVILLSATIGPKDIEILGLGRKAVVIQCDSPIPSDRRPIVLCNVTSVNRSNMDLAAQRIADYIKCELMPRHVGEKGVIHATYQMSGLLQKYLDSPPFIFHDRDNKKLKYREFLRSKPSEGRILVACGMYEGIDLPEDLGRWQVVAKVPWMSLGNPAIKHMADKDQDWYLWETLKTLIQACGRICRTEKDFGVTYLLDSSFYRLQVDAADLFPKWFSDAITTTKVPLRPTDK